MDIKKSPLNEEEKILQPDIVTNARKRALGSMKLPVLPSLELPIFLLYIQMFQVWNVKKSRIFHYFVFFHIEYSVFSERKRKEKKKVMVWGGAAV